MDLILSTPQSIKEIVDVSIKEALNEFEGKLLQSIYNTKKYEVKEAAKICRCSEQTVYQKIRNGELRAERFGRKYLISHSDLFNNKNEVKSLKYKRDA